MVPTLVHRAWRSLVALPGEGLHALCHLPDRCAGRTRECHQGRLTHLEAAGVPLVVLLEGLCVPLLSSHILLQTVCPVQGILPQLLDLLAKEVGRRL